MYLCNTKLGNHLNMLFGNPKQGIHSYRFLGFAIFDVVASIIGALIISYAFKFRLSYTLVGVFVSGIILHWIFCVDTTLNLLIKRLAGIVY